MNGRREAFSNANPMHCPVLPCFEHNLDARAVAAKQYRYRRFPGRLLVAHQRTSPDWLQAVEDLLGSGANQLSRSIGGFISAAVGNSVALGPNARSYLRSSHRDQRKSTRKSGVLFK